MKTTRNEQDAQQLNIVNHYLKKMLLGFALFALLATGINYLFYFFDFTKHIRIVSSVALNRLNCEQKSNSSYILNVDIIKMLNNDAKIFLAQNGIKLCGNIDSVRANLVKYGNTEKTIIYSIKIKKYPFFCRIQSDVWCGMECGGRSSRTYFYLLSIWIEISRLREDFVS